MGYQDRDYMREHREEFFSRGRVVAWLIGITVAAYVVQGVSMGRGGLDVVGVLGVVPYRVIPGLWLWQLVTHALLHEPAGIWHLLMNMLFLWWIGSDVAEVYGTRKFLALYVGGAVTCGLAHTAAGWAGGMSEVPGIGASGAIMAVAVVAAFLYPTRRILVMWLVPVPLWILVSAYVLIDLYYPLAGLRPWVASAGHLGGAFLGLVFVKVRFDAGWLRRLVPRVSLSRKPSRDEVDRILAKISADGIGSLTDAERDTLKRASQ